MSFRSKTKLLNYPSYHSLKAMVIGQSISQDLSVVLPKSPPKKVITEVKKEKKTLNHRSRRTILNDLYYLEKAMVIGQSLLQDFMVVLHQSPNQKNQDFLGVPLWKKH